MSNENKFRLRFWFWHQEVVIDDITADELITTSFFRNEFDTEHQSFSREVVLEDVYNQRFSPKKHRIEVNFDEENDNHNLIIAHLKDNSDDGSVDINYGENGWDVIGPEFWILERI